MTRRRITRFLCAADPRGSEGAIERLGEVAAEHDADAIAVVGDLGDFRTVFKGLGRIGLPAYWVPGRDDAPIGDYLREAHNLEVVFGNIHGVHGTAAFAGSHILVTGHGGHVDDDPEAPRDETEGLTYPRWEAEYRLKLVRELDEHESVLLFSTPPAHKGQGMPGSEALAELVGTYRPRLVVCGGERGSHMLGRSLVVAPGSLADGHFAVADLHTHEVQTGELAGVA